ncbi:unnamed protein product [Nesidiocoris tenuis]|uniref:Uncharacterized protein n=1 Tax=Nesidiocoris tenuis TaxID=355587 RepID=A0A6H5GU55_9HEMI|nr:unnamed protein product [Nesidiocoris tenuis]
MAYFRILMEYNNAILRGLPTWNSGPNSQSLLEKFAQVSLEFNNQCLHVADWLMRSPLSSTGADTLVCPWAGEENGLTCDTAFSLKVPGNGWFSTVAWSWSGAVLVPGFARLACTWCWMVSI